MELSRMIPPELRSGRPTDELPETKDGGFNIYDHIERLRFIDTEASPEELKFINKVFESALTGLEQFLTNERYATLKGKMRYNAIGICYDGGRDDRVIPELFTDVYS
jgi:import receptor subunit TOM20